MITKSKKKIITLWILLAAFFAPYIDLELFHGTYVVQAASISINKNNLSLVVGNSYTLKVNGTSKTGKWHSTDENIAAVNSRGKVTALKAGKTDIYVYIVS
ncbi:MAG: hypothetical protein ACFWTJ_04360 [Lachnoclostridium sp.]|jgi:hypothetical protein